MQQDNTSALIHVRNLPHWLLVMVGMYNVGFDMPRNDVIAKAWPSVIHALAVCKHLAVLSQT